MFVLAVIMKQSSLVFYVITKSIHSHQIMIDYLLIGSAADICKLVMKEINAELMQTSTNARYVSCCQQRCQNSILHVGISAVNTLLYISCCQKTPAANLETFTCKEFRLLSKVLSAMNRRADVHQLAVSIYYCNRYIICKQGKFEIHSIDTLQVLFTVWLI